MNATISEYIPASWFHEKGIHKVRKRLLEKLPDVSGNLFLTLTIDRSQFEGPEEAYDKTRDNIRRFFHKLRNGVQWEGKTFKIDAPYFVKTEFHDDGAWPHYHIIFRTRRFLPDELLRKLWKYGITQTARIKNKDFHYLLKYVTKGGDIPDWILKRKRIRIIQASRGFYIKVEPPKASPRNIERDPFRRRERTIGERLAHWMKLAILKRPNGTFTVVEFPSTYLDFISRHVIEVAQAGAYLGNNTIKLTERIIDIWKRELIMNLSGYTPEDLLSPALPNSSP